MNLKLMNCTLGSYTSVEALLKANSYSGCSKIACWYGYLAKGYNYFPVKVSIRSNHIFVINQNSTGRIAVNPSASYFDYYSTSATVVAKIGSSHALYFKALTMNFQPNFTINQNYTIYPNVSYSGIRTYQLKAMVVEDSSVPTILKMDVTLFQMSCDSLAITINDVLNCQLRVIFRANTTSINIYYGDIVDTLKIASK